MEELWFKFKSYLSKLVYFQRRSRLQRYLFPVVITILVLPLIFFLPRQYFQFINSQTISFLAFVLIATLSSWYGGLGPGLFATLLVTIISYFTVFQLDLAHHSRTGDLIIAYIFLIVGFFISVVSEARYEADLQKDEFLALTAHEIKNPLSVIRGFAGLIRKKYKNLGKNKLAHYAEEIDSQSVKLSELIDDLLDMTKIEIGKFVYKDELFNFSSLMKEMVTNQQMVNSGRTITLTCCDEKIVRGDKYRIGQVINNLLTNAIKYSPQTSPIKVSSKCHREEIIVSIKDSGIGVPKSEQKDIFKYLYRSKRSKQGKIEGLGLGLFISSQIMKHHKGKLWVESNRHKGSTFFMQLPKNY